MTVASTIVYLHAGEGRNGAAATDLAERLGGSVRVREARAAALNAGWDAPVDLDARAAEMLGDCAVLVIPRLEASVLPTSLSALLRGVPVIAADTADFEWRADRHPPQTVTDGRLAARIAHLLSDPAERERCVRRGRATVKLSRVQAQLPAPLRWRAEARREPWPSRCVAPAVTRRAQRLSVVIACRGGRALTEACVHALRAEAPDAEIVLVDNASPDDTATWGRAEGLRVIRFRENRGVAPAWNAGLRAARGSVLAVLNNDTVLHPGGLHRLRESAWRTGIAAFQGGLLGPDLQCRGLTGGPDPGDYPDGCALFFRRDVWERVGWFDEGMELAYCEDSDWGLRARSLGFDWELVPDALTHLGQRTAQGIPETRTFHRRNQERLRLRWQGKGAGERIKVRRWGMLGDVLMLTPVLAGLRREKPLARLHLQCAPPIAELLQGLAEVDVVSPVEREHYTSVHDLDYATWELEQAGQWRHPTYAFADALGVAIRPERYRVPEPEELAGWAKVRLPGTGYVACGLRSEDRDKANWGEAAWRGLFAAMPERRFVLLDRQSRPCLEPRGESYFGPRVYDLPNVIDLTGATPSLRHVAALLRRCSAAVCVDSGLYHLTAALGLPVVALMGGAPGWARQPLAGVQRVLQGEAPCYPCPDPRRCRRSDGGPHCLEWVSPERVAGALRGMVAGR